MPKRKDYIGWDAYFMGVALLSGERSKDPNSQVGACIVSEDNKILSIGYNGFPRGCSDDEIPWDREGEFAETKYPYVCHGELNAILNYRGNRRELESSTLYVTLFPCNECAKIVIQAGIKHVVFLSDKYATSANNIAARRLFDACGVKYEKLNTEGLRDIEINLK